MEKDKQFSSVLAGIIIAVVCLALVVVLKAEPITGSAVYIKYYGVSDGPLTGQAGKIQTYVKLTKDTINDLQYDARHMDVEIADNIAEVSNFDYGLVDLYEANPPVAIQATEYNKIMKGAESLVDSLRVDTVCIRTAGLREGVVKETEFVVVTELVYTNCQEYYGYDRNNDDWLVARAKHTFYTKGGEYLCGQESYPLFIVNQRIGDVDSNVGAC